ncbi:hypothetical protein RM572_29565, partial [Streptomyces sp. DSM 42041]|nr:hypothetical protein [Streptomyces sp. DSM 42041]
RRIRAAARIPLPARRTLEEKWAANTRPLEGGHLEWTGERVGTSRSPIKRYREQLYSPGAIAFRMRTGRHAVGRVQAECGVHQCVAPACVEDQPGRKARRDADRRADRAYRVIFGETAG